MSENNEKEEASAYQRPSAPKIEGETRRTALAEYIAYYSRLAVTDPTLLNQKLPRKVFLPVLDKIGNLLLDESKRMSCEDSDTIGFLERNQLPQCLGENLTPAIRTFALLLNALSQWTTAQKLAMDRFVFSGNVRKEIRSLATTCIICPEAFDHATVELHHPVRDGRPPIPLSKKGHEQIEGIVRPGEADQAAVRLVDHRNKSRSSWIRIRIGCMIEQGCFENEGALSKQYISSAKNRFRKATEATDLSADQILEILDRYELGQIT